MYTWNHIYRDDIDAWMFYGDVLNGCSKHSSWIGEKQQGFAIPCMLLDLEATHACNVPQYICINYIRRSKASQNIYFTLKLN